MTTRSAPEITAAARRKPPVSAHDDRDFFRHHRRVVGHVAAKQQINLKDPVKRRLWPRILQLQHPRTHRLPLRQSVSCLVRPSTLYPDPLSISTQVAKSKPPTKKKQFQFFHAEEKNSPSINGVFSNFWMQEPICLDEAKWPSVEHFFQAEKFKAQPNDSPTKTSQLNEMRNAIRRAANPSLAKRIADRNQLL